MTEHHNLCMHTWEWTEQKHHHGASEANAVIYLDRDRNPDVHTRSFYMDRRPTILRGFI